MANPGWWQLRVMKPIIVPQIIPYSNNKALFIIDSHEEGLDGGRMLEIGGIGWMWMM